MREARRQSYYARRTENSKLLHKDWAKLLVREICIFIFFIVSANVT